MSVPAEILLKGAWFSLEQCGHLQRDAVTLHASKAYASAVALALLAREELGRYRILLDLWRKAAGGSPVSVDEIRASCDDHVVKQREAQLSITYRAEGSGGLAGLLRTRMKARPGTPEYTNADEQLKRLDEIKLKWIPGDRHSIRMKALYVDINDGGTDWNRPTAIPEAEATNCLVDAVNDYSVQADKLNQPEILREIDATLATALDAWQDKPPLPVSRWPEATGPEARPMTSEDRTKEVDSINRRAFDMAKQVAADPSQRAVLAEEARSLKDRLLAIAGELDADPRAAARVRREVSESVLDLNYVDHPTDFLSLRLGDHLH